MSLLYTTLSITCFYDISESLLLLPVARVFDHTSRVCLDVEVSPKMPWTKSKAVSEGNGPLLHDESGFGKLKMVELYRVLNSLLERGARLTSL